MFIATLFTIAKIEKQSKCPPTDEWKKKCHTHTDTHTHTHTEEYYSAIKKNEIFATGNNMDGPWGHYAKWNKSDREKYHIISFMYGILKKQTKTQNTKFKDTENKTGGCQRQG